MQQRCHQYLPARKRNCKNKSLALSQFCHFHQQSSLKSVKSVKSVKTLKTFKTFSQAQHHLLIVSLSPHLLFDGNGQLPFKTSSLSFNEYLLQQLSTPKWKKILTDMIADFPEWDAPPSTELQRQHGEKEKGERKRGFEKEKEKKENKEEREVEEEDFDFEEERPWHLQFDKVSLYWVNNVAQLWLVLDNAKWVMEGSSSFKVRDIRGEESQKSPKGPKGPKGKEATTETTKLSRMVDGPLRFLWKQSLIWEPPTTHTSTVKLWNELVPTQWQELLDTWNESGPDGWMEGDIVIVDRKSLPASVIWPPEFTPKTADQLNPNRIKFGKFGKAERPNLEQLEWSFAKPSVVWSVAEKQKQPKHSKDLKQEEVERGGTKTKTKKYKQKVTK